MATNENLPPRVIKQLARELKSLDDNPPEDIRVIVNDDNLSTIFADIDGPNGTPYEGGLFRMKLVLSQDFPQTPPKGYFITKIFHPNISKIGEICVNTLKKDWKPTLGLRHVLLVIRCLLIEPFPESALNEEAGKMLMEDYEGYARHARLMTSIHAQKPKPKPKVAIGESNTINTVSTDPNSTLNQVPIPDATTLRDTSNQEARHPPTVGHESNARSVLSVKNVEGESKTVIKPTAAVDKKKVEARKKSLKRL